MFFVADDVLSNAYNNVWVSFAVDVRWVQINRLRSSYHHCQQHQRSKVSLVIFVLFTPT